MSVVFWTMLGVIAVVAFSALPGSWRIFKLHRQQREFGALQARSDKTSANFDRAKSRIDALWDAGIVEGELFDEAFHDAIDATDACLDAGKALQEHMSLSMPKVIGAK